MAALFVAFLLAAPTLGGGACMESYPLQCPVVELVGSGLATTGAGLVACVLVLVLASTSHNPKVRLSSVALGFAALFIVMILGTDLSLAHTVEVRYH